MAHFYGTVQGGRGEASRLGHKRTGLRTSAEGWGGKICVHVGHDSGADRDMAYVTLQSKNGRIIKELYEGPLNEYVPEGEKFTTWMAAKALTEDTPSVLLGEHLSLLAQMQEVVTALKHDADRLNFDWSKAVDRINRLHWLMRAAVQPFKPMLPKQEEAA